MKAYDLNSIDQQLVEAANTGMEHAKVARILEDEVKKLKAIDRQIDRKLEHIKLLFEAIRDKLKSYISC